MVNIQPETEVRGRGRGVYVHHNHSTASLIQVSIFHYRFICAHRRHDSIVAV